MEDNELNREIAVALLSEYGFQVDTAEDGAEAVEKVKNSRPGDYDLVLMDVQMPVMNGYEATEQIRSLDDPARGGNYDPCHDCQCFCRRCTAGQKYRHEWTYRETAGYE